MTTRSSARKTCSEQVIDCPCDGGNANGGRSDDAKSGVKLVFIDVHESGFR
jgi:hypothetical protein